MASLQDQFLKAGLVNKNKAKQLQQDKPNQQKIDRRTGTESVDEAKLAARNNAHYHEMIREGSRKTVEFLDECGLIGGPSKALLRRAHVI